MSIQVEVRCQDYGRPGCLGIPDERYTMRFDDIGEPPIYFCSHCGPIAEEMNKLFQKALSENGEGFIKRLDELITKAEEENKAKQS